jgi:hypothetical protein
VSAGACGGAKESGGGGSCRRVGGIGERGDEASLLSFGNSYLRPVASAIEPTRTLLTFRGPAHCFVRLLLLLSKPVHGLSNQLNHEPNPHRTSGLYRVQLSGLKP